MKRAIYRKWKNEENNSEHFLIISPNGQMTELTFEIEPTLGIKAIVYNTARTNPMDPDVFAKNKEICSKFDYDQAKRKMIAMVKSELFF